MYDDYKLESVNMSFYDFLVSADVRTAWMGRMMQKFMVDRELRCLPDHAAVVSYAVDRCRSCGHQDACADWLEQDDHPDQPTGLLPQPRSHHTAAASTARPVVTASHEKFALEQHSSATAWVRPSGQLGHRIE